MAQVRDLFNPKAGELRIRNDPKQGFYVEKLTRNAVANISSINKVSLLLRLLMVTMKPSLPSHLN